MNFRNISILVKHYIGNPSQYLNILIIFIVIILLSTLPVNWNITGNNMTFLGVPLKLYGQSKEDSLVILINNFFSYGWIFIVIFSLSKFLKKLSESFLVKEILWLRLLPCSPYEVALSRALWIISYTLFIFILGTIWAITSALYHQISISELLINVEGLVSHILLSGGIVIALNLVIPFEKLEQNSISAIALISPLILVAIYLGISRSLNENLIKYFPYSFPFHTGLKNTLYHFGTAALMGGFLLCLHTVINLRFSHVKSTIEKIK